MNRDLGPAGPQQIDAAIKACTIPHGKPLQTVWSRRVLGPGWPGDKGPGTILLVREPAPRPANHPPLWFCLAPTPLSTGLEESEIAKLPTRAQGILLLGRTIAVNADTDKLSPTGKITASRPTPGGKEASRPSRSGKEVGTSLLRVRPEIARIQSRYVWNGGVGPWSEGAVADGFGFTQSLADTGKAPRLQQREEFRAYDSDGKQVPLQY